MSGFYVESKNVMWGHSVFLSRGIFRSASNINDKVFLQNWRAVFSRWLFSQNSSIIDVWQRPRYHCVKSVRIRSFSGLYFPAFGLNLDQSKWGKIRTRKTTKTNNFFAVYVSYLWKRVPNNLQTCYPINLFYATDFFL